MKTLVHEFLAGGGVADQHPLDETLCEFLRQGTSMLVPFCADLLKQGHQVVVPLDPQANVDLPEGAEVVPVATEGRMKEVLCELAEMCDQVVVIAPETDGCLEEILALLQPWKSKLLCPGIEFVRLTADKWKCHRHMRAQSIPCPRTWKIDSMEQVALLKWRPGQLFVVKPIDGAGSEGVRIVEHRDEIADEATPCLLQQFVPGEPVSVLAVSDGTKVSIMEPGRQVFDTEPIGTHIRTEFPLSSDARKRTIELAQKVVSVLPESRGYFGMDLVIGESPHEDVLIEVNPRLTTSYGFLQTWNRDTGKSEATEIGHRPKGFTQGFTQRLGRRNEVAE